MAYLCASVNEREFRLVYHALLLLIFFARKLTIKCCVCLQLRGCSLSSAVSVYSCADAHYQVLCLFAVAWKLTIKCCVCLQLRGARYQVLCLFAVARRLAIKCCVCL